MKPRLLMVTPGRFGWRYRIVKNACGIYVVEQSEGLDAMRRECWRLLYGDKLKERAESLIDSIGEWLFARRKSRRKARGKKRGGAS